MTWASPTTPSLFLPQTTAPRSFHGRTAERPSGGRRKPGFAVTDNPRVGLDPNQAAIAKVVETHGLDLRDFHLTRMWGRGGTIA
jgi:hypothetical protein